MVGVDVSKGRAHQRHRPVQSRFRGADRDPQRRGDVGHLEIEVVAKDDDRSLVGRKSLEDQVKEIAVGRDRRDVVDRWSIERRELDFDRTSTATPKEIEARAGDETSQPTLESIRIAKGWETAPRTDEAILDRVPREIVVPEHEPGSRIQPRDEHPGKQREGVMIAPLRSLDEFSLVHGPPDFGSARRLSSRSDGSRRPWPETFPADQIVVRCATR